MWAVVVALSLETCWFAGVPVLGAMSITREESNREFQEKQKETRERERVRMRLKLRHNTHDHSRRAPLSD